LEAVGLPHEPEEGAPATDAPREREHAKPRSDGDHGCSAGHPMTMCRAGGITEPTFDTAVRVVKPDRPVAPSWTSRWN